MTTPHVPAVLAELAQLLMRNAAPSVPEAERAGALGVSAGLLGMAAEMWDGAAARLVDENRALRVLLAEPGEDADLRLSALETENHRLRRRLIEAHVQAEASGDGARQDAIWTELRAATERRRISTAPV